MWEKVLEFVSNSWYSLTPIVIINQYEKGVILRLGEYHRTIAPGPRWKIPVIDAVHRCEAVQTSLHAQPQSLTTYDDVGINTSGVLWYEIADPYPFLLKLWEGSDFINDVMLMCIRDVVAGGYWQDLNNRQTKGKIKRMISKVLKPHGIKVIEFGFADLSRARTYRIIGDHLHY